MAPSLAVGVIQRIGDFSNVVFDSLGADFPVTVTAPLLTTLEGSRFFRMFLDQVLNRLFAALPSSVTAFPSLWRSDSAPIRFWPLLVLPSASRSSQRLLCPLLQQIFGAVVFLLLMLGVLVIYALILGDVEAKTYEYGMLRVLGMRHRTLAQLICVQSVLFSAPGNAVLRWQELCFFF